MSRIESISKSSDFSEIQELTFEETEQVEGGVLQLIAGAVALYLLLRPTPAY